MLEAINVSKSLPDPGSEHPKLIVSDFTLHVTQGELITIFGPNGAGKSTVLNLLSGVMPPDSGSITIDSKTTQDKPNIGYVFQNYSETLLPWYSVRNNIAFPLKIRGIPSDVISEKTSAWMSKFHLTQHANKYVYQLSGGLKQLVAIARSTIYNPELLLLDEPFSALDYSISRTLWLQFREFWSTQRVTTLFVSHNIDEAVFLGDRVCVLSARPTQIVELIDVHFGKERPLSILTSQEFFSVRAKVLNAFERGRKL